MLGKGVAAAITVIVFFISSIGFVHAGVKGIRWVDDTAAKSQQQVDETAEKFSQEIDRIVKEFKDFDQRIVRTYLRDTEEMLKRYEQEMAQFHLGYPKVYGKEMAPIFLLRVVEKFKPYPSENGAQKALMEREGFTVFLTLYGAKRSISAGDARHELKNALFEMFELDTGVWDTQKKAVFDVKVKEILGYSLLMSE